MNSSSPSSQRGFSLMEILVSMAIISVMVGIAVMSIDAVNAERRLRRHGSQLEVTARLSMQQAMTTQRTHLILLRENGFGAGPVGGEAKWHLLPKQAKLEVLRAGDKRWRSPSKTETWQFRPGVPCEPLSIRILIPAGRHEMSFDAMTGAVTRESLIMESTEGA